MEWDGYQGEEIDCKYFKEGEYLFSLFKKKGVPFHAQLKKLEELGIKLNQGIEPSMLFEEFSEQEYQNDPYQLLLLAMGGEIYRDDEFHDVSNNIWHLDTECIEDHGDYIRIIDRLKNLTNTNILDARDFVDVENEKAWVSFEFESKRIQWDMDVDNDWLDPEVFNKFNELIKDKADRSIVVAALGQDCLIAYLNKDQLKEINKLVKYKFKEIKIK